MRTATTLLKAKLIITGYHYRVYVLMFTVPHSLPRFASRHSVTSPLYICRFCFLTEFTEATSVLSATDGIGKRIGFR